ncbi:MAG TPA: Xaa-Pro peptidase family protein [Thermomicrobiales bacterium]|nr:Xaa-Pro peptidase family protein [Thermomicrobiales bacterium]
MAHIRLPDSEYETRRKKILETIGERGMTGLVLFNPNKVGYFSRFSFIQTERPMAYVLTADRSGLLIPMLEREHAEEYAMVDDIVTYPEYPGERHPLEFLKDMLIGMGLQNAGIAVDSDGYGQIYGYRGPKVSELLPDATVTSVNDDIEYMQMINSEAELNLIRESCKWGNLAHHYLQEFCEVGVGETDIALRASVKASLEMMNELGSEYRPMTWGLPASAGFRGQVGKDSALPHAISSNVKLQKGDVLVTGAGAAVWGYGSELERTMVMGEPTKEQETYFNHMFALQTLAMDAIKPGIPCSAVDQEVMRYFREHNLMDNWRHHTGHAKSQLIHEAPFLDVGDDRIIEVGMVFTVEPGVYVPGFAGFRHSDTVAVTETGIEMLTFYPRDLESLTIAV